MTEVTGKALNLTLCRTCGFQCELQARCPRCHARLHLRFRHSIQRTWALLLAALILYVPANVYPITVLTYLGQTSGDTIMSGVIALAKSGMLPIALLVFAASIFIPFLKITGMMLILLSIHFRWKLSANNRLLLHRFISSIGHWSILDLFVISIMAALMNLGNLATFIAGPASTAFAAVVVLSVWAAESFDPRLIWDLK